MGSFPSKKKKNNKIKKKNNKKKNRTPMVFYGQFSLKKKKNRTLMVFDGQFSLKKKKKKKKSLVAVPPPKRPSHHLHSWVRVFPREFESPLPELFDHLCLGEPLPPEELGDGLVVVHRQLLRHELFCVKRLGLRQQQPLLVLGAAKIEQLSLTFAKETKDIAELVKN